MKRRLLFLFAVFMVATSVGWGQTDLYVSTSGSDGNGGGVEAPLATIAKAIEKATDGATIHLAEGTFPVSSTTANLHPVRNAGSTPKTTFPFIGGCNNNWRTFSEKI